MDQSQNNLNNQNSENNKSQINRGSEIKIKNDQPKKEFNVLSIPAIAQKVAVAEEKKKEQFETMQKVFIDNLLHKIYIL